MNKVMLKEVCKITNGFAFKSEKYVDSNGARIIRITNVQKGKIVDNDPKLYPYSALEGLENYQIHEGDILMSLTGNVGRVGRYTKELLPGYLNQRICRVKSTSDKLYENYLFHFLNSDEFEKDAIRNSAGAAQLNLSSKWLDEYKIPLPPLEQQKKIAAILDAADAYRQKTKALITKYDELAQSLFLDMFGDPVKNEKGWEFFVLNDLITQKPDNGFFAKKDKYGKEGTQVVWLTDFIDKLYISETNLRRAEIQAKDRKYMLEYGDALFCRSSLNVDGIGKCSIAPKSFNEPVIFECHIIRLRFNLSLIIPEYFRFLSDTLYFRDRIMRNAKTSTMTTISQEGISEISIPVPDIKLQALFRDKINVIVAQKAQAQASLEKAEELFASLLQRAFKGELV